MKKLLAATAFAALATAAIPANAAIIDFTNIQATWQNPTGGSSVSYSGNGTDNATISWGTPSGQSQKSSYTFTAAANPSFTVNPPAGSAVGTIGTFTHNNFPISSGSGITGVQLLFNTDVLIDGALYGNVSFVYDFSHWETPNSANPCGNGGSNYAGVNVNGCADQVRVNFNQQSDSFTITDGDTDYIYALDVFGFMLGGNPMTEFWTVENQSNTAYLRANVVLYSEAGNNPGEPTPGIPEPATWAMLIAGFGLVGTSLRRRRMQDKATA